MLHSKLKQKLLLEQLFVKPRGDDGDVDDDDDDANEDDDDDDDDDDNNDDGQ